MAAVISLAACGSSGSSSAKSTGGGAQKPGTSAGGKSITIDFVSGPLDDSFFPPLHNGAEQAATAMGVKLHYIPASESDIAQTMATTMKVALAEHPDAIAVTDFVDSAAGPLIKKAVAEGIPVYVVQSGQLNWQANGAIGFIGNDPVATGNLAAKQMIAHGSKNVVCVINGAINPYLTDICKAYTTTVKAAGSQADTLSIPNADSTNPTTVTKDIQAYLTSHHGVDGVFSENAAVATSSVNAIKAANLAGKVYVGGLAVSALAEKEIQSGQIGFLITEQQYLEGYDSVVALAQFVKYGLAPIGQVNTGPSLINKSNIAKVLSVSSKYPNVLGAS